MDFRFCSVVLSTTTQSATRLEQNTARLAEEERKRKGEKKSRQIIFERLRFGHLSGDAYTECGISSKYIHSIDKN